MCLPCFSQIHQESNLMVHRWVIEFLLVITAFSTVFVRQTTEVNTVPHCGYGRMEGTVSLLKKCGDGTEHV